MAASQCRDAGHLPGGNACQAGEEGGRRGARQAEGARPGMEHLSRRHEGAVALGRLLGIARLLLLWLATAYGGSDSMSRGEVPQAQPLLWQSMCRGPHEPVYH